jgi:hypothetical protein
MFESIELELTRIRRMADEADDNLLRFLIDGAIREANAKTRAANDNLATAIGWPDRNDRRPARK